MHARETRTLLDAWLTRSAAAHPNRPAVIELEREVTLQELHERSLAIASGFQERGLGRGDRVCTAMEKSADAIAVIFGTLLAGGVWVPIQPGSPPARVAAIVDQCDPRLMVTDADSVAPAPPTVFDRRSGTSIDWSSCLTTRRAMRVEADRTPDDTACILFTSGSTGIPKGVTLSHRAVGVFVDWSAREFGLGPDDRIACPSPLTFDLSTFDVFNIARSASACVVIPRAVTLIPRLVLRLLREQLVTVWYSVPSLLTALVGTALDRHAPAPSVRAVLFAGEVILPRLAAQLRDIYPKADLCNLYGPTETNVVTWYRLPDEIDQTRPIPIGRPCPFARVRLEDPDTRGTGHPLSGSLLVAGESVMSGYWNRPEDTAAAMVVLGEGLERRRYYRTGDRVTLAASGELGFIGRQDRQVKRRGFRIDLGEIEAALARHPSLAEVAVVASGEASLELSAFVVPRSREVVTDLDLSAHCARFLPSYMMPDRFHTLGAMPRASRGKIDYEALRLLNRSTQ